jgi:SM-20-related protein
VPKAEFFQRLGLYAIDRFLDAEACRELREAVRSGSWRAGTVGSVEGTDFSVDASVRSVRWVNVGETMAANVRERLLNVKPAVEDHYHLALTGCEPLQFLAYGVGDHYKPHRDHYDAESDQIGDEKAATSKARRVSAVIFLNSHSESAAPNHYGGGALTFYGLFDNPSGKSIGIPLEADEGLLVTFPSGMLHAVAPVTHGERYTIATWFF